MTLRTKLLLAQAPLVLALALMCILSVATLSSLGAHSQTILKDNYRSVLATQRMKDAIERLEDQSAILLLTEKQRGSAHTNDAVSSAVRSELDVQERNITEPGEAELTTRLRALWIRYQEKLATARKTT